MAALPAEDQAKIVRGLQRYWSNLWDPCQFSSPELSVAVAEIDIWFDDNAANINNSLSEPFRSNATQAQKALMVIGVVTMRYGDDALLRAILGGID